MKTLIIEDDALSRLILTKAVEERGHQVLVCENAEAGIVACAKDSYPLIVLDLHLPGINGLEFCRWVRSQPWGERSFILVATARNQAEDLEQVLAAGADDYVSKPFDVRLLQVRLTIAERQINEMLQRRETQQLNRSILRTAIDGFCLIDGQGRILEVNDAYSRATGYEQSELIGQDVREFVVADPAEIDRRLEKVMTTGGDRFELQHRCRNGNMMDFDVTINYSPDGEGKFFIFLRDNTERKKLAEERLRASKLESIGILAGGIAHEFNNALTAVIGNLSLTRAELPHKHAAIEWIDNAHNAAARATGLASQLLTFAKGGEPMKKMTSVGPLLHDSVESIIRGAPIQASFVLEEQLWPAEIDAAQIGQVIDNVVLNAKQAMPDGGELRIEASNYTHLESQTLRLAAGQYIRLSVIDSGCGISPDVASKIFDPYFTTKESNSGLGLAICYSIIKKHGGTIAVESTPGKGSNFQIYLPAKPDPAILEAISQNGHQPHAKVLLMDDDPAIRDLISILLSRFGYNVTVTSEGAEAIQSYSEAKQFGAPFDAVIMDLTIPEGMGGVVAVQELLKIDPEAKAIVCSGYSSDPVMANFHAYGFKARLAKPFNAEDLNQTLAGVIGR